MMRFICGLGCLVLLACGAEGADKPGSLSVALEAEETIIDGIEPGADVEQIRDGWRVKYDNFVAAVGNIELRFATDEAVSRVDDQVFVVDLTSVSEASLPLWELSGLKPGRWNFGYSTPQVNTASKRHKSVTREDFAQMLDAAATYLIRGGLSKTDGVSCPPPALATVGAAKVSGKNAAGVACYANPSIAFEFVADASTVFGPCSLDGIGGVSIPEAGTQTVTATLHGDHVFFNGFPEGSEGGVLRLAQWLADSDLNLDGKVTKAELQQISPADLSEIDARYQLGAPPLELTNQWEYLRAQLKTQGHMNGEGECPLDGEAD